MSASVTIWTRQHQHHDMHVVSLIITRSSRRETFYGIKRTAAQYAGITVSLFVVNSLPITCGLGWSQKWTGVQNILKLSPVHTKTQRKKHPTHLFIRCWSADFTWSRKDRPSVQGHEGNIYSSTDRWHDLMCKKHIFEDQACPTRVVSTMTHSLFSTMRQWQGVHSKFMLGLTKHKAVQIPNLCILVHHANLDWESL